MVANVAECLRAYLTKRGVMDFKTPRVKPPTLLTYKPNWGFRGFSGAYLYIYILYSFLFLARCLPEKHPSPPFEPLGHDNTTSLKGGFEIHNPP